MRSVKILDAIAAGLAVALVSIPAAAQSISQPAGCIPGVDCSAKTLSTSGNITAGSTISTTGGDFWFNFNGGNLMWGGAADVKLTRDAAGVLSQRNGANAQTFNLYGTYTDGSNYERLTLAYDSAGGRFRIFGQRAGTGSGRSLDLGGEGAGVFFTTNSIQRWQIDSSGNLLASADNGWDIGANGANRPRNLYVGSSINSGGDIASAGNFSLPPNQKFQWNGGAGYLAANSSGVVQLGGNSGNPILQFGGTTSSFPSIKRNAAAINFRLADDSADAAVTGASFTASSFLLGGNVFAGSGAQLGFQNRTILTSSVDANLTLQNNSQTGFALLQFGGTTSSFPAWKRNGVINESRLADDSADAPVQASYYVSPISSQSGTSYTVVAADSSLIFTNAGTVTATLPTASSFTGRQLRLKATGGGAVNSVSSNVVPLAGGAAGTAILSAAAGKWALLQSDGTNWIIMAAN